MKIQKDVALALATVAAIFVALFAAFVTIPVWFEAVIITLAVIGACLTVSEIVKAYKASYDETEGTYTYKFPVRAFVIGVVILLMIAAIILLCLKALFGFALIPVALLLITLFVIAYLKNNKVMQWILGLLVAILVVVLVSYAAGTIVNNDVDLNPGISTETTAPETTPQNPEIQNPEINEEEDGKPVIPETKPEEETQPTVPETKPEEDPKPTVPETKPEEDPKPTVPETKPEEDPKPTVPETKPEEDTKPVEVKINVPNVMYYAEPITVTLEGCKANDLCFTDEEYYSIVIVSETEVTITLVGAVLEDGTVERIPFSKSLTISDNVSGVNVTIDIVDENDTTEPEIQEPEIKDEEEEKPEDIVEDIEKPEEETEPTVPETKPEEEVIPAPIAPKINAPETIVYAEPIIITLEGIKAENLKFSNEDFLSIVIISDSEVEVTLIGIVNDAGEVEFIPGSGYITVTDSVSGVNAYIEIAEADEIIFNEPEIKDEEDEPVIDTPVVEVEKPEIEEEVTPVEVRIYAPETMVYAEPVIINLDGIKAEDLKFSDEEFFSIVIISDTEVEITLVGIVNDAGEVEFAPEAGYVTITDSVSGIHTTIWIVG